MLGNARSRAVPNTPSTPSPQKEVPSSQLMKRHKNLLVAILASALTSILTDSSQAEETPPNIIIILSDDQAWTDYGFMGHKVIKTPHLDKLAEKSIVYERGYVASPLCRPSLASILTGKQPFEHCISGNDVNGHQ